MAHRRLRDIEANELETSDVEAIACFDGMGLRSDLLRSVYEYGFESPSTIQQRGIVPMINGNDIVIQAPSGTGKALSLCISALQIIDPTSDGCQALLLTPTREMARQLHKAVVDIGKAEEIGCFAPLPGLDVNFINGNSLVYEGQQLVVGTPGRVLQLIESNAIATDSIRVFALHEADEMVSRGFGEQMFAVRGFIPRTAQVVLASITMPDDVRELATTMMRNPTPVVVKRSHPSLPGPRQKHYYIAVEDKASKIDVLCELRTAFENEQIVVFCNLRRNLEWLANELNARQVAHMAMHGDMMAFERADIIKDFRAGSSRTLLATNMLARGLDIQKSSLVVNYDVPSAVEQYVHRTSSVSTVYLVEFKEADSMHDVEQHFNVRFERLSISNARRLLDAV